MHSKILQISSNPKFNKITEDDIPSWFTEGGTADYIDVITNPERELELQWDFLKYLEKKCIDVDDNSLTFTIRQEETGHKYFEDKYEYFMKNIKTLNDKLTLKQFSGEEKILCDLYEVGTVSDYDIGTIMHYLQMEYDDKFGIYIYNSGDESLYTLDDFMRSIKYFIPAGEKEQVYYLGSVIDYHY